MFELTKNLMKRTNLLMALLLLAASSVFWKCGDSAPPPVNPQDAQLAKITKTWKSTGVKYATTGEPQPVLQNLSRHIRNLTEVAWHLPNRLLDYWVGHRE